MRNPIVSKAPVWKAATLAAVLGLAMVPYPAHAAPPSGSDTVQGLYDVLLSTMKNGRTLGQSGRFTKLEPVIRRTFDIPSMARLSVGSSWGALTEAQRQQVTESFARYISAIYADRFDSYAGQQLQVTGEHPAAAGVMVRSQIVKANGELVKVDYMMRRDGNNWLISDIYLDDQRTGDPSLRIRRDPEEPGHRRPNRSAQPQGGHPDRDYGKGIVALSPRTWLLATPAADCDAATDCCVTAFRVASQPDPLDLVLSEPSLSPGHRAWSCVPLCAAISCACSRASSPSAPMRPTHPAIAASGSTSNACSARNSW